ncbi:hypothetical protein OS189_08485 [Sulfitobacter sp. F26169L]|uniref:hypothetical protein n=1 Tax=Sulfitobacter sp. F26169L TaxID=2996015 RepID=UPI002260EF4D|nr:hypothetical protein [Sulfitobacter sp. F26169L]MCX7566378.1 hypothetical protein [Sulfitobacter sp. F26169L]
MNKLKSLPVAASVEKAAVTHQPAAPRRHKKQKKRYAKPAKPAKKRKSLFRKFAEEAFDLVEDIFD